ncbi:gliding motility-associated C-terminal domain-containing protein [Mucilaginibacter sp. AW1-3]
MKKIYLFIFLIVIGLSQNQSVKANISKTPHKVVFAPPAAQTITFTAFTTPQTFGAADITLTATASSGLAVSFSSSNTSVATIVNNKIHLVGVGTAVITASQPGDGVNYSAAPVKTQTLTVNAGAKAVISAFPAASVALQSADITPPAVSTYAAASFPNYPITYTSSNPAVATIINNRIHLVATGTTTITASQAGNGNFPDATPLAAVYTITAPPAPTFSASLGSKAVGSADFDPGATLSGTNPYYATITYSNSSAAASTGASAFSIVNNKVRLLNASPSTNSITATITYPVSTGGTATVTSTNTTLVITAATTTTTTPAISFTAPGSKAFSNIDLPLTASSNSIANIPITFTSSSPAVATIVNGNIHYVGLGTSTITASQGGGTDPNLPPNVGAANNLTVTAPLISFTAVGSKAFTPADFTPTVTSTLVNVPITLTSSNPAVATIVNGNIHFVGIGTSTITATQATAAAAAGYPVPLDQTSVLTVTAPVGPTSPAITFAALGSKVYANGDVALTASSTATNAPQISFTSSNPAVAIITNGLTFGIPTGGTGYVNGTYINVPLTGGSGTGELATIVVANNIVTTVTPTTNGSGYNVGDVLSCAASSIGGGSGSGFNITVLSLTYNLRYIAALPAPNNTTVITASQGGGVLGNATLPPDVSQTLVLVQPTLSFPTLGTKPYSAQDIPVGAISSITNKIIVYTSSNPAVATINNIATGTITTGGSSYVAGTYYKVPMLGGSGSGATATITVASGAVTGVTITANGPVYAVGDVLTCASSSIGNAGSGFTYTITGYTSNIHFNNAVPAAPNNTTVITASQGGGANGTTLLPPDASQTLTVTQPTINFPALGTKQFTSNDLNPGATGSNFTTSSISTFNNPSAGSGYTNGVYYAVPLNGGSGTGATATITVIGGVVTSVIPVSTGINYLVGDILNTPAANIGGTGSGFQVVVSAVSTGFPITYTSSNPAVATIVNNYIHFVGTGTTTITASQNGPAGAVTGNISLPPSVSQQLIVTAPTISFALSGTRTFSSTDVNPGATSTITNIPITYVSSNPAVATIINNSINGISNFVRGAGYVNGIYPNVALTGGSGTGATATLTVSTLSQIVVGGVVVSTTNGVTSLVITSQGSGYTAGDVLSCPVTSLGGTSTNTPFSFTVASVGSAIHFTGSGTVNITATQGGGATGTSSLPADVTQSLTVTPPTLTLPALGKVLYGSGDINPAAISTITNKPITYTSSNTSVAKILTNSITALGNPSGGSGYLIGTYSPVPLIYANGASGTGTGATAQILVVGGSVTGVTIISGGTGYQPNDQLTCDKTLIGGTGSGFTIPVTSAGGVINLLGTGTTTITASQGGGATGTATLPPDASQVLTVGQNAIVMAPFGTQTLTAADLNPGATSSLATTPIVYTSSNTAAATIVNGFIHFVATGTTVIKASQGGGATGTTTLPPDVTQTLTITAPLITFPPLTGVFLTNGSDVTPAASSTINAPITYTSSNTAVATIVNGNIHIVGPGTATIKASQQNSAAGTVAPATTTLPADQVQSFTVTQAAITLPVYGTKQYTDVDFSPGASSPVAGIPFTYTSSNPAVATIANYPTFNTPITGGSGYVNGTYNAVPLLYNGVASGVTATVVVSGGSVVSFKTNSLTALPVVGVVVTVATSNIGGGSGSGFNAVVNGNISMIHLTSPVPAAPNNTTTITAGQAQSGATPASQLLTVVAPVITFPALGTITYNNNDITPGATSTVTGIPVTYTSDNPAVATIVNGQIHIINQGTAKITATQQNTPAGNSPAPATGFLPADVQQTLTITGTPAITFAALGSKPLNSTDLAPGATSTYTLKPITYTSSNTAVATIVNGNIHFVGTGTATITASQGGGTVSNGVLPVDATSSLTVTAPLITFASPGSKALTDIDLAPGATSTISTTPITYTSSNTAVATIVNGNIHFIAPGTTTIKASQGGGATGTATLPADVSQTLTVTNPVITFGALASKPYQINDIGLGATSTLTTVPITYTSSDPNVATIVNNAIHIVGMGTTTITASQNTDAIAAGYIAPADVTQPFVVTAPTLVLGALGTKAFTSTDLALTTTGSVNAAAPVIYTTSDPSVATIVNGNFLHYTGIGTCYITASQGSYQGSPVPLSSIQVLTVTPATITFAALGTKATNSGDVTLGATSTLTGPGIVYTSSDPTVASIVGGNTLHLVAAGSCVITASQPTSANYAPLPVTSALVLVPPIVGVSTPTITFQPLGSKPFSNTGDYTPTATASNSATLTFTSSNPAVATIVNGLIHPTPPVIVNGVVTYASPNTTVITASAGGGPNGVPGVSPADVSQVLTITPATITFPPLGQQIFPTTPVIANLSQVRFNTNDLAPAATSNYQLVTANNTAVPITYTSSNPAVATIVNGNIHFVGLGITTITASLGNVVVADVSQNLEVIAPLITFATTRSVPYSTIDVAPAATSTLSSVPITYTSSNPAVATIVNGNIHLVSAGITTITATQAAIGNSTIPAAATQVLTVTPAATLTFAATRTQAFSLTDLDPGATSTITNVPITYTSNNPGLVSIVNNKLHFNIPPTASLGNTAIITATQAGSGGVPAQVLAQTLTVTPIVIAQTPLNKYYGDADFSPAISSLGAASPVLYASATTTVATAVTNGVTVGTGQLIHIVGTGSSAITASSPADNTNAAAANAAFTLTVVQAPMSITPKNVTYAYGAPIISFPLIYDGFKSASGNVPLDDSTKFSSQPIVSINGRSPNGFFGNIPVGTYQLTASGAVSTLYTFTYGKGTLTIVPAVQTLTWDNFTGARNFGDADFDPLARSTGDPVTYTSSNPAVATIVNGKVHIVGIGTATITASISPTSGNYTGSASIAKVITVGPGAQTITVATIPFQTKGAAAYSPNATASSGLAVTMTSSDPTIVKVVGTTLVPLHVGSATITFTQPGNANYAAAPAVTQYVQVVDPSGNVVKVDQAVSPNGDGINEFLYVEGLQNYPDNHIKIIDRNGGKVYSATGYDNKNVIFTGKDSSGHQLPAGTYFYLIDWNAGGEQNHITGYFVLKY